MRKILYVLLIALMQCLDASAQFAESITAFTDKDCYAAGERIQVSVAVQDAAGSMSDLSKVAYVELCDTRSMVAHAMVQLSDGRGWASMTLPSTMHSGFYQLTAYTSNMRNIGTSAFHRSLVGVVNTFSLSSRDNVKFVAPKPKEMVIRQTYNAGQKVHVSLPKDSCLAIRTLSVVSHPLGITMYDAPEPDAASDVANSAASGVTADGGTVSVSHDEPFFMPELEGHIVRTMDASGSVVSTRLSGVGKGLYIFDGKPDGDGNWSYITHSLNGSLPIVLNGYDASGAPVRMQPLSPYAQVMPRALPLLEVGCTEAELKQRGACAQNEMALQLSVKADTLKHVETFLSRDPDFSYDVTEYTGFSTIREALLEYVKGVSRRKMEGRNCLFVSLTEEKGYSRFPALVLLDGMPVYDVEEVLAYDARYLNYIQVYGGSYTFGSTTCHGVISFITKKGLLSNYKLDAGTRLVRYDFPQNRPPFTLPQGKSVSTVYWNPLVDALSVDFPAPTQPGIYQVVLRGVDTRGNTFTTSSELEVK